MTSDPKNWGAKMTFATIDRLLTGPGAPLEIEKVLMANGQVQKWYKNAPPNMRMFLLGITKLHGALPYIVFENERYTYAQVFDQASRAASIWHDVYGIRKGDKVGICMRNFPEWIFSYWACYLLGAVPVLVNAWVPGKVITHCLTFTGCKLIVLDPERAERLEPFLGAIRTQSGAAEVLVAKSHEGVPSHKGGRPKTKWAGAKGWNEVMERYRAVGEKKSWQKEPECIPDDDGTIFFTSGTTGLPKAVLHGQRSSLSAAFYSLTPQMRSKLRRGENLDPAATQRVALLVVPLFHVTGVLSTLLGASAVGGRLVIVRKWDVDEAVGIIEKESVTSTGGVPSIAMDLLNSARFMKSKNVLESIGYGGAPASPMIAKKIGGIPENKAGKMANAQGYGMTETGAPVCAVHGEDSFVRPLSAGLPSYINDLLIMDPKTKKSVPTGKVGQVWMRGPNIMKGYYKNPEATRKILTRDGWLNSEDLGYLDEEGFLYLQGRTKDLIIRGGENIDVSSVENAFYEDDRVLACAVVGVPDERLGELPTALVVLKNGVEATESQLIEEVIPKIPKHAVPVMLLLVKEQFEMNAAGKILKEPLKVKAKNAWEERKTRRGFVKAKARM